MSFIETVRAVSRSLPDHPISRLQPGTHPTVSEMRSGRAPPRECNSSKGRRTPDEAGMEILALEGVSVG